MENINSVNSISFYDISGNSKMQQNDNKSVKNNDSQLSEKEKEKVEKLKKEDQRVRAHENAHKSAAGNLSAGGPNYKFKIGPDGKKYAIGGHVRIDISEVPDDPDATIRKAQKVKAAALAPADPSAQDLKVVMQAARMEAGARLELAKSKSKNDENNPNTNKNKLVYGQIEEKSNFQIKV